jgi:stage II sporulation protein AA (anti-sigma F factor antagonist)
VTELSVEVTSGDPAVITVVGEIDLLTAPSLVAPLRALIDGRRASHIEVDLGQVPFMDSTGIQVLAAARSDAQAAGIGFRVRAASDPVKRVLNLTGLLESLGPT